MDASVEKETTPQAGKVRLSWTLFDEKAIIRFNKEETMSFDLAKLFPDFMKLTEVQKTIVFYGVKQKLSDCIARPGDMSLTIREKKDEMEKVFNRLAEGKWNSQGEGKASVKKRATELAKTANKVELGIMKKLGLI